MKHIVVDLEMNKVSKNRPEKRICSNEIIEIGAVMLDDDLQEISCFRTYVKPEYNDVILPMITQLTGITDATVANAPHFNEAMRMFAGWCLGTGDDVILYAWSGSDYQQIRDEIRLKGNPLSENENSIIAGEWSDFQHEFDSRLGFDKQVALEVALDMSGIGFIGRAHDALDDSRSTAELLKVFRNEELFEMTLRKIREAMNPEPLTFNLSDLINKALAGVA